MSTVDDVDAPSGRARRALVRLAKWAGRVRDKSPRPIGWFLHNPQRLTALVWVAALMLVGSVRMAAADDLISGPDLAGGGPKTLFEQFDLWSYQLTIKPDDENSDWLGVSQGLLEVIGFVNYLLLWLCLGLLYGGLTLLEWFLNLTIYRDSAGQIDAAVQMVANHVFWPLISATVAIGAFMAYAKWRGDGRGFLSDLGWVVAAAALACGFAMGPSTLIGGADQVRQNMANGLIAGSSEYVNTASNPVGYPTPDVGGDPKTAATRKLVDGLWSTFGAQPWCFAEFRDVSICREAGHHALANDDTWKGWMQQLDNGSSPAVFKDKGDYIRGQDMTRTGVLLLLALVTIPLSYMLLRLVIAGLIAVVGLLLMLVVGLLFLTFWPIEGWFRKVGTQYWVYTLGLLLQGLFITVTISGVMVVSTIIATQTAQYGFFLVALLNVALLYAAVKARSWLEMLTSFGGTGSMGIGTALIARSITRTVIKGIAGAASGGTGAVASAAGWAARKGRGPDWSSKRSSADQPRNRASGLGQKMAGMDGGPLQASSTRVRQPGTDPQLGGTGTRALPTAGSSSSTATAGAPGGHSTSTSPSSPSSGQQSGRRVPPMAAQNTNSPTAGSARTSSPSDISDGHLQRNVAEQQRHSGHRGRVWVASSDGRGAAPLDDATSSPSPARERRGTHTITTARRGPRRGEQERRDPS